MSQENNPTEVSVFEESRSSRRVYMVDPDRDAVFDAAEELESRINYYSRPAPRLSPYCPSGVWPEEPAAPERPRYGRIVFSDGSEVYRRPLRGCYDRRYRDGWWSDVVDASLGGGVGGYCTLRISAAWWTDVADRRHVTLRADVDSSNSRRVTKFVCEDDPQRLPMMACPPLWAAVRAMARGGFSFRGHRYDPAAILVACDHFEFDPKFEQHVRVVRAALQPE